VPLTVHVALEDPAEANTLAKELEPSYGVAIITYLPTPTLAFPATDASQQALIELIGRLQHAIDTHGIDRLAISFQGREHELVGTHLATAPATAEIKALPASTWASLRKH
jgi:hypothetical protein